MRLTAADFTGPSRKSGDQTCYQTCPACGDSKWHFYVSDSNGGFYCFKCEARGFVDGAPITPDTLTESTEYSWAPIDPPPTTPLDQDALQYLMNRGIAPELATHIGLRRMDGNRLYIPFTDSAGNSIYWIGRSMGGEEPKYLNLSGVPCPLWDSGMDAMPPVLVEGVFDAIAVTKAGFRGIALGGKAVSRPQWPMLRRILHKDHIVRVCLDGDATREAIKLTEELALAGYVASVIVLDGDRDPGGMTPVELLRVLF